MNEYSVNKKEESRRSQETELFDGESEERNIQLGADAYRAEEDVFHWTHWITDFSCGPEGPAFGTKWRFDQAEVIDDRQIDWREKWTTLASSLCPIACNWIEISRIDTQASLRSSRDRSWPSTFQSESIPPYRRARSIVRATIMSFLQRRSNLND